MARDGRKADLPKPLASQPSSRSPEPELGLDDQEERQGCFKCRKKGNMFVLCECSLDKDELLPDLGQILGFDVGGLPAEPTKLRWVVGPYWNMLCMTYAVVITITFLVYDTVIPKRDTTEVVFGLTLSGLTIIFLSLTAFSDPGIFPKHTRPRGPNWSYSGQAQSFRPPSVIYCRECKLLIENYDHFCPWSGTVIGGKNLKFFHCFVSCLVLTMLYDAVLLVLALASPVSSTSTSTTASSLFIGSFWRH